MIIRDENIDGESGKKPTGLLLRDKLGFGSCGFLLRLFLPFFSFFLLPRACCRVFCGLNGKFLGQFSLFLFGEKKTRFAYFLFGDTRQLNLSISLGEMGRYDLYVKRGARSKVVRSRNK
jgi:hypothetical protein